MKKHELIKYAYDNYPKGIKFYNGFLSEISTGKFTLWQPYFHNTAPINGVWRVNEDGKPVGLVYDGNKWAEIITEKPDRKFIMTSEDGVDLYEGDRMLAIKQTEGNWRIKYHVALCSKEWSFKGGYKFFFDRESAEKWIEKANKPKQLTVKLFDEFHWAKINKNYIEIKDGTIDSHNTIMIKPSDLEDMLRALKSL